MKFASKKRHLTIIAALLSMIGPFSIDAYLPSFPSIESDFNVSRAMLSQSIAAYLIAFAFSTLLWGPVSDRIGRRLVILSSLSIYIIASIGCAYAVDLNTFLTYRMLQGLAASGGFIASRAMIRDAHNPEDAHKAMSHVVFLFAAAPAIAPLLGAWLQDQFGWRSVFVFLTLFGITLFIMTYLIKETLSKEHRQSLHPKSVFKIYTKLLTHKQFIGLVFSISFSFGGLFLYIAGAPTVIYSYLHLSSHEFSFLFVPVVLSLMAGAFLSGKLSDYRTKKQIIITGYSIMAFGVLLNIGQVLFLNTSILYVVGPLVVYVFGMALIIPAITIMILDYFPHNRGAAASMQSFFQMLSSACVAGIVVPLLQVSRQYFVFGQAVFLILAIILWYITLRSINSTR